MNSKSKRSRCPVARLIRDLLAEPVMLARAYARMRGWR